MTGYRVQLKGGSSFLSDAEGFSVSKEGELYMHQKGKDTAVFNRNEWIVIFQDNVTKVINKLAQQETE